MEFLGDVLTFLARNIFNQVAILIGLLVLIGLAIQGKSFREMVEGTVRADRGPFSASCWVAAG